MKKSIILWIGLFLLIFIISYFFFNDRYDIMSIIIVLFGCLLVFLNYERKKPSSKELVLIASLTALGVVSRLAFAFAPGITPLTSIIIIVGVVFGKELGFMVGCLSALLSNFYFGQGPWTPFQMFAWGLIGILGSFLNSKIALKNIIIFIIFGAFCGLLYSLILDLQTMFLITKGRIDISIYLASIVSSSYFTIFHVVSNVIFLGLLTNPLIITLERIKNKYGIFNKI